MTPSHIEGSLEGSTRDAQISAALQRRLLDCQKRELSDAHDRAFTELRQIADDTVERLEREAKAWREREALLNKDIARLESHLKNCAEHGSTLETKLNLLETEIKNQVDRNKEVENGLKLISTRQRNLANQEIALETKLQMLSSTIVALQNDCTLNDRLSQTRRQLKDIASVVKEITSLQQSQAKRAEATHLTTTGLNIRVIAQKRDNARHDG